MRLSTLQIGLIVAGALLVLGVLAFNAWQMHRARRRLAGGARSGAGAAVRRDSDRVVPSFS